MIKSRICVSSPVFTLSWYIVNIILFQISSCFLLCRNLFRHLFCIFLPSTGSSFVTCSSGVSTSSIITGLSFPSFHTFILLSVILTNYTNYLIFLNLHSIKSLKLHIKSSSFIFQRKNCQSFYYAIHNTAHPHIKRSVFSFLKIFLLTAGLLT